MGLDVDVAINLMAFELRIEFHTKEVRKDEEKVLRQRFWVGFIGRCVEREDDGDGDAVEAFVSPYRLD